MEFTLGPRFDVTLVAFWTVEDRRGVFKTVESLAFACESVFHHALSVFYPPEHDSHAKRQDIIAALAAGQVVHLDTWGLQLMFIPGGYKGVGGGVSAQEDLECFYRYAVKQPKQVAIGMRPR